MSKVSVLIPAYNAEDFIKEALVSVIEQSYNNIEVIVIDDGSIDNTAKIVNSFHDSRIKYVKNEKNLKITKTLNKGLRMINSEYIIRMDADDIMLPGKIKKQVKFMDNHPEIAVSGTEITKFYNNGRRKKIKLPKKNTHIKTYLLFDSALMHPTVIIRNEILKKENYEYDERYVGNEDFGLWYQISRKYKLANMRENLLLYRVSSNGITQTLNSDINKYDESYCILFKDIFNDIEMFFSDNQILIWRKFTSGRLNYEKDIDELVDISREISTYIKSNSGEYDINYFNRLFMKNLAVNSKRNKLRISEYIKLVEQKIDFLKIDYIELFKYIFRK